MNWEADCGFTVNDARTKPESGEQEFTSEQKCVLGRGNKMCKGRQHESQAC